VGKDRYSFDLTLPMTITDIHLDGSRGVKREREEEEADEAGHGTPTPSFAPPKRTRKTTGLVRK